MAGDQGRLGLPPLTAVVDLQVLTESVHSWREPRGLSEPISSHKTEQAAPSVLLS